ncbi:MAG TPA: FG-GAP-like repeat-containing protein, partial [Labilithrix sp.]
DKSYSLGGNNFGVACVDVDDDGDMDVLFAEVAHGDVGLSSDPTEIAFNPGDGSKFTRPGPDALGLARSHASKLWDQGDNMPAFVDVDLDGKKDLFLTSTVYPASRPWLFHQKPDGTFEEIAMRAGIVKQTGTSMGYPVFSPIAQGVDFVDYDGDGDLDLIVGASEGDDPVRVFRNDIGQDSNFVRVKLVGGGVGAANTAAIGARVRVTSGGHTQTLEVKGGEGIGNIQNDFVLTFGLGAACDDVHVEVRWPDAQATVTTYDVRANYTVLIDQTSATVTYR